MGFYTDLDLDVVLHNMPENVMLCLNAMLECDEDFKAEGHSLFSTGRWLWMFGCSSIRTIDRRDVRDATLTHVSDGQYKLHVRSCFKNYDDEINKLLDFLSPYAHDSNSDMVGRTLNEDYHSGVILYDRKSCLLQWHGAGRNTRAYLDRMELRINKMKETE